MAKRTANQTDVFVGQRVRMARLMAKLSQTTLGEKIGVTFQQVQKYERGGNRISSSRLQQISDVLDKPVSWFFDENPGPRKAEADIVQRMLVAHGGLQVAAAYAGLTDNNDRHLVIALVTRLARKAERVAKAA